MAKMSQEVIELFNDAQVSKALATLDATGTLNVVPKGSLRAIDDETIAFADIMGDKTNANLEATSKAAVVVFKMPPAGYQIKGTFQGSQTSGPLFDTFAQAIKQMMNIDIRAVGVIKVDEVYSVAPPNPGAKLA